MLDTFSKGVRNRLSNNSVTARNISSEQGKMEEEEEVRDPKYCFSNC